MAGLSKRGTAWMTVMFALAPAIAHAQSAASIPTLIDSPLLLAPGQVQAAATLEVSLQAGDIARPWSVAPDFRVGVVPRFDVGIMSSSQSLSKLAAGSGICVGEKTAGCDGSYRNVAVDARYLALSLSSGNRTFELALRTRLLMREFSPVKPALLIGAFGKWRTGKLAVTADPYIQLGLANRDRGNRHQLAVPLWFTVAPSRNTALHLFTSFSSEFAVIRDGWRGAAALQFAAAITPQISAEIRAGFPRFVGPQNTGKERLVSVTVTLHQQ